MKIKIMIFYRLICLFLHIIFTSSLYWVRIDLIIISTNDTTTWTSSSSSFTSLISFSLICLLFQSLILFFNFYKITFVFCFHLLFDFIGLIFILWIVFDGLTWKTYIVISIFCV